MEDERESRRAGGSWGYLGKAVCERVLQAHLDASMCLPIQHEVGGQLRVWGQAGHVDTLLDQIPSCCSR